MKLTVMLSSHVKRSPSLWLHNKSRLFYWCLYNKQNIMCPLVDMKFIFKSSPRYLTRSLCSLVRYRVIYSKIKWACTCNILYLYNIHVYHSEEPFLTVQAHLILFINMMIQKVIPPSYLPFPY